jgi:MFS family permease
MSSWVRGGPVALLRRLARFDVLALTATIWFLAKFLRYAFPPLFGTLQDAYGVSTAVVGTAFSGLMLVYALAQFPSGTLADRLGAVRIVAGGAVVAAVGALSLAVDAPFAVLVVGMLLVGLGTGAHKTVAIRLLARVYPARTGRALGAMDTVGAFGGVVAPAVVVALAGQWRLTFLAGGVAGVGLAGAFALRAGTRTEAGPADDGPAPPLRTYLSLFADRRFAAFAVVAVLFSFAYNGVVAFLPLYLVDAAGLAPATASLLYSGLFALTLVQLASGELADRIGEGPVLVATPSVAAAGLAGVLSLDGLGLPAMALSVGALGLGSHGFRPVRGVYLVRVIPEAVAGGTLGIVRTGLMTAGAVAPGVVGALVEFVGYRAAFAPLLAALAGAALVAAGLALTDA